MGRLKVSEVFCYICRGILIEPVTLPCFHVFCFTCFEQSMQETSYSCPLCRKRISNWVRSIKRNNKLVNEKLWTQIKEQYKNEVLLKLKGEDDGLDQCLQEEYATFASSSKPGEVAQEFSKFLSDFQNEVDRIKEAEELASRTYIMKLKEEEERQLQILQENNMTRIKEDSMLALKIQEEINKEIASQKSNESPKITGKKVKKVTKKGNERSPKGPMDEFLKVGSDSKSIKENDTPNTLEKRKERSTSTESTDSIRLEMNLFKPIKKVRTTPSKHDPDGRIREVNLTKVTPLKLTFNNLGPSSSSTSIIEGKKIHSIHSAFADTNMVPNGMPNEFESPSKRLRYTSDENESTVLKDITLGDNAERQDDSVRYRSNCIKKSAQEGFGGTCKIPKLGVNSLVHEKKENENDRFDTQDYIDFDPSIEEQIIEEQRKIEKIILQEKEDRELALRLSREWESEIYSKPQTRSMKAAAMKNKKNVSGKTQQTLIESLANRRASRKK